MVFFSTSSEVIFSFLIEMSMLKVIEKEIACFHSLGNPKGRTLDYFFYASLIRHNVPYKLISTYISELVEIFLKLSMKTVQVYNYWDNFSIKTSHKALIYLLKS